MGIIAYIIIGCIVGIIGRATLPIPRQMGFWSMLLLGMVGGIVGGLIGAVVNPYQALYGLNPTALVASVIGAILVVVGMTLITRRRWLA
jgi:uncharacterized membrane protein YeaQ/YmgE (transglycosylase-associated protein family)